MAGLQPDVGDVHVNGLLTQLSIAFRNLNYVADEVFPPVMVEKQSDIIPLYDRDMWLRSQAARRGPGTKAARSGYTVDNTNTYFAVNWAIGKSIPDEVSNNADSPYNLERDSNEWVTDQIQLLKEVEFARVAFTSGNWTTTSTGTSNFVKWNDYGNSDPIGDIRSQMRAVRQIIGRKPNTFAMGEIVWNRLQDHPDILDRIKGAASPGNPALVTRTLLAQILELETVSVADALQVTSEEGAASEVRADVIDDDAILIYRPQRPSLLQPAAGYGFFWRPLTGGGQQFIRRYREEPERQTVIEAHSYFDYNVTSADAGMMFIDAVD